MTSLRVKRRRFVQLSSTSAGLAALSACKSRDFSSEQAATVEATGPGRSTTALRVRKSWNTMTSEEKGLYAKAVELLQRERVDSPGSQGQDYTTKWQQLAFIHQNDCPHNNWFFLPWHRVYLAYFESELIRVLSEDDTRGAKAKIIDTFGLPYWDWSTNPKIPAEFWSDRSLNPQTLLVPFRGH